MMATLGVVVFETIKFLKKVCRRGEDNKVAPDQENCGNPKRELTEEEIYKKTSGNKIDIIELE